MAALGSLLFKASIEMFCRSSAQLHLRSSKKCCICLVGSKCTWDAQSSYCMCMNRLFTIHWDKQDV